MPTNLRAIRQLTQSPAVLLALLNASTCSVDVISEMFCLGEGQARRFYMSDCAAGIVFLLENHSELEPVNLGYGKDVMIEELALLIKNTVISKETSAQSIAGWNTAQAFRHFKDNGNGLATEDRPT